MRSVFAMITKPEENAYSHTILDTPEAIAAEAPTWNAIVDQSYEGHPCLSAGWFLVWLEHFASRDTPVRFVKITRHNTVVAYLPFVLAAERLHGVDVRALRFAGNVYSPVNTPIVRAASRTDLFDYVVGRVLPTLPWSVFMADDVPLDHVGPAELHVALSSRYESYLLPSEGSWAYSGRGVTAESYFAERDTALRQNARRWPKKLGALGRVEMRVVSRGVTEDDIRAYQDIYARSWKVPELDPTFHPAVMRWASDQGWLRLFFLLLDGRPIATHFWLVRGQRAYALKRAYDEQYRQYSAGAILTCRVMEHVFDVEHVEHIDFLKGDDAYKRQWSSERRQRLALLAFSPDFRGQAARLLDREILPWVRRRPMLDAAKRRAATWLGRSSVVIPHAEAAESSSSLG
jgi:CelD/BcsL family acetyltransferase involved in cellulose biosynthesis